MTITVPDYIAEALRVTAAETGADVQAIALDILHDGFEWTEEEAERYFPERLAEERAVQAKAEADEAQEQARLHAKLDAFLVELHSGRWQPPISAPQMGWEHLLTSHAAKNGQNGSENGQDASHFLQSTPLSPLATVQRVEV